MINDLKNGPVEVRSVANGWMVKPAYNHSTGDGVHTLDIFVFSKFEDLCDHLRIVLALEPRSK